MIFVIVDYGLNGNADVEIIRKVTYAVGKEREREEENKVSMGSTVQFLTLNWAQCWMQQQLVYQMHVNNALFILLFSLSLSLSKSYVAFLL